MCSQPNLFAGQEIEESYLLALLPATSLRNNDAFVVVALSFYEAPRGGARP